MSINSASQIRTVGLARPIIRCYATYIGQLVPGYLNHNRFRDQVWLSIIINLKSLCGILLPYNILILTLQPLLEIYELV